MKTFKYFHLYQDCFIVKGSLNTLIIDHYTGKVINLPNSYIDNSIRNNCFLDNCNKNNKLISILSKDDFGYFTNSVNPIKKSITWKTSRNINEIIIEHKVSDSLDLEKVYGQIENVGAEFIQIRFLEYSKEKMNKILSLLENSGIRTIEILFPFLNDKKNKEIIDILGQNNRVQIVYFYNSPSNQSIQYENLFNVLFYQKNLTHIQYCGIIDEDYFITDLRNFSKSVFHNNCLKDKLYISHDGTIKNCPSLEENFGNVSDTTLDKISKYSEFAKYRDLNKDKIEVCKDCEFRYICTDCRAYTERTHEDNEGLDISKPLKCGYDPYTGEWEEWSTNPLKQKAIQYYGMDQFI